MGLTALLILPRAGGLGETDLWPLLRDLSGDRGDGGDGPDPSGLGPQDRLVAVCAGACPPLDRFAEERGWRAPEIRIRLEQGAPEDRLEAAGLEAARAAGGGPPALRLGPRDRVRPAALARLSRAIGADAADDGAGAGAGAGTDPAALWIVNHAWAAMGPRVPLPCADAGRWPPPGPHTDPDTGTGAGHGPGAGSGSEAAPGLPRRLMPDPRRLVPFLPPDPAAPPAAVYDARLAAARTVRLFPEPVVLRPLPEGPGPALSALAALRPGDDLPLLLERAEDALHLAPPGAAQPVLAAAAAALARLPRRDRRRAASHDGPLGRILAALAARDRGAALAELALLAAAGDRALAAAAAARLAAIETDLERALPGPDYLRAAYDWLRRP